MNFLDSLLDAIVRLDGDALVMHVGEKPYVVTTSAAMNAYRGPLAWGQVELSSRVLTVDAVLGMLGQILPLDQRQELEEIGAIEYEIPASGGAQEHFKVVAARGGDDVWLEVRRQVPEAQAVEQPAPAEEPLATVEPVPPPVDAVAEPIAAEQAAPVAEEQQVVGEEQFAEEQETPEFALDLEIAIDDLDDVIPPAGAEEPVAAIAEAEPLIEVVHEVSQAAPTEADVDAMLAASAESLMRSAGPAPDAVAEAAPEPAAEAVPEPVADVVSEPVADAVSEPVAEAASEPVAEAVSEPVAEEVSEPVTDAVSDPIAEAAAESVAEAVSEPVAEAVSEPVAEAVSEPAAEAVSERVAEAVSEPVAEAVSEPVAEATEAPIALEEAEIEPEPRAVVVPLTRSPVRVASTQAPAVASGITVDDLLRVAAARGASAVYVVAQSQPMVRTDGEISALDAGDGEMLTHTDVERIILELSPPKAEASQDLSVEWMCDVPGVGRVRCLAFSDHRGPGVILRMIPHRAISADQLALTPEVQAFCTQSDGLVLVTGPRASGKTTLMNAFVDLINRTRSDHVITIEPQIGFVHESRRCFISQREVRGDAEATLAALRAALREGPDVLFVEDVRTAEIAAGAMQAAEAGRLVFASMSSPSTTVAIERLLDLVPADRRQHAQGSLAASLRGVVSQVLVRRTKGGRLAAREILLNTPAVAGLIQDGRLNQLRRAMESGARLGMVLLGDALAGLVRDGTVHVTEAYRRAVDKEALLAALKREGIDTSFAERLA